MPDLYLTENGDLAVSSHGDLVVLENIYQNYSQQAYIRMMTERGDFSVYPTLGASLERLHGMPNTPSTGEMGAEMIREALDRESVFAGVNVTVEPIPIDYDAIRFDIYVTAGSRSELILSIEQNLSPITTSNELPAGDGIFIEGGGS